MATKPPSPVRLRKLSTMPMISSTPIAAVTVRFDPKVSGELGVAHLGDAAGICSQEMAHATEYSAFGVRRRRPTTYSAPFRSARANSSRKMPFSGGSRRYPLRVPTTFVLKYTLTAQPEPSGGHEAVEGGAGDAGDLGDGGLGDAQLGEIWQGRSLDGTDRKPTKSGGRGSTLRVRHSLPPRERRQGPAREDRAVRIHGGLD